MEESRESSVEFPTAYDPVTWDVGRCRVDRGMRVEECARLGVGWMGHGSPRAKVTQEVTAAVISSIGGDPASRLQQRDRGLGLAGARVGGPPPGRSYASPIVSVTFGLGKRSRLTRALTSFKP